MFKKWFSQSNLKLKCQQDDHKDEIETVCYNQYCTEFRLNCFKCLKKSRIHHDHFDEIEKINTLMDFIERKNLECDNLINDLNKYVESLNKPFFLLKMEIRYKQSLQKERLVNLDSFQINDFLNSTIKFFEQKQSITTIISEQIKKLTNSFNNLSQQLQLSQVGQINMRMQSIGWTKHQLMILSMFFPQVLKGNAQDYQKNIMNLYNQLIKHCPSIRNIYFLFKAKRLFRRLITIQRSSSLL